MSQFALSPRAWKHLPRQLFAQLQRCEECADEQDIPNEFAQLHRQRRQRDHQQREKRWVSKEHGLAMQGGLAAQHAFSGGRKNRCVIVALDEPRIIGGYRDSGCNPWAETPKCER